VIQFHCGHDHSQPYPEAIGYVPQRLTLDARLPLTVRDFLALTLGRRPLFLGISKTVTAKSKAMLERVGVADYLDVPVEGLSGGQLQRVLLALALEPQPELLLLDEPAAGIDFKDQKKFYELIASLNRELGVTVLLVSHDLNMVQAHAHDVLCLRGGAIQCHGPPGEILTPINMSLVFGAELNMFPHRFGA
jgi:zinc transport system ATP-binding protein